MSDLNLYVCTGRFGQDPQSKYTPSGTAVCNFSLAVSRQYKDKNTGEKQDETQWLDFVAFGKTAELISEYMRKGSQCRITGRMQKRKWQDKEGKDRYTTECVVEDFQMLGKKAESDAGEQPKDPDIPF